MKYFAALLFVVSYCIVNAQPPAGVANAYMLGDKDGYTGFNYALIFHASSGKVYTRTYDGEVAIHGNNYTLPLTRLSHLSAASAFFLEITEDEILYADSKKIAIIKGDTVYKLIAYPDETFISTDYEKNVIAVFKKNNYAEILFFNGLTQVLKKKDLPVAVTPQSTLFRSSSGNVYFTNTINDSLIIYQLNTAALILQRLKAYAVGNAYIYKITDENNLIIQQATEKRGLYKITNGLLHALPANDNEITAILSTQAQCYPYGLSTYDNQYRQVDNLAIQAEKQQLPVFISQDITHLAFFEKAHHSFYAATANKPLRIFSDLKKYPFTFNHTNANAIFSVQEDNKGNIWAGSYQGAISYIHKNQAHQIPGFSDRIENGGTHLNQFVYMIAEGVQTGLIQLDEKGTIHRLVSNTDGFSCYAARDKKHFYYGTSNYNGLWETPVTDLEKGKPVWNKIDSSKGILLNNILSVTEDSAGRIWCGHPRRGIAVYDPATGNAKTWLIEKKESAFGAYAAVTDKHGTVWMGSGSKGLWYYNDYTRQPSAMACKQLDHPLLNTGNPITALTIYNEWLIISATDKMLLLNLDSFYSKKKTIIRYLNPQEAGFSSVTEQNTLLTASDSTVWFSTSDMLYQWDIRHWLSLPAFKVKTTVIVSGKNTTDTLTQKDRLSFEPGFTSFDITVQYLSPDNMPRYTNAVLLKEGDPLVLPVPALQNNYTVKNLAAGSYYFILNVFEMDGAVSRYVYPVLLKKFLWQHWWFWALLSAVLTTLLVYLYHLRRKSQLAEEKAKTKEAELLVFKTEQEKKLASLQLVTLSSQFRPHFILNALNTIGAEMDQHPGAESVLSRLGESINLIFTHAQQQQILHPFENEWTLVINVIHIHRLMYLKQLQTNLPDAATIERFKNSNLPLGILQIPVENALLHGLSNKETGPWILSISVTEKDDFLSVTITDNGVGRQKSATLSNSTKHGTGTKNLQEIITIINATNRLQISIRYIDNTDGQNGGTAVVIEIPKQLTRNNE